jgi:hypothetical protein
MVPGGRAALEDQRGKSPAGQFQRRREPGRARADDEDLGLFFFLTAHRNPPG